MIQGFGIFILFLFPLVLIHEIGHFLFARLFGVRVEVFSIGFGPKLFKFVKGGTQYAVSLIPLGGYIKMFGDNPFEKDDITEEDKKYSFNHKGRWARFWIIFGGPLANIFFAFFLFYALLLSGEKVPEVRFGVVEKGTSFYSAGVRTGDVLFKMNDMIVSSPTDMAITEDELVKELTVKRHEKELKVTLSMRSKLFFEEFSKHPPLLRTPVFADGNGGYFFLSRHADRVDWGDSIEEMREMEGTKVFYLFKINDLKKKDIDLSTKQEVTYSGILEKEIIASGLYSVDLSVDKTRDDSPASRAGILPGDILVSLNKKDVNSFEELRLGIKDVKEQTVTVSVLRKGRRVSMTLTPELREVEGEKRKIIGVYSGAIYVEPRFVEAPSKGFFQSGIIALHRTWDMTGKTLVGFGKLLSNQVSFKNVGGPISIGKVATDSFNMSLSYFFQIMAIVSINLGLINLFPIPILDGGHIVFIILEIVNRGPVSRRKMEIAQQFGLSLLLLLMLGAFYNDIMRHFQF